MHILASLSDVIPSSVTYDPMAGFLFMGLLFVGCLAFFVEVFVRSTEPRPSMPGRRVWHRTVAALLCAPGILHAILFCLFAFRARAILSAASLLGLYLPMALLPEGAVNWWYD